MRGLLLTVLISVMACPVFERYDGLQATTVQQPEKPVVIPTTAIVSADIFPPLRAKHNFTFQVTFDPPPRLYGEGSIEAWFECEPSSSRDVFVSVTGDEPCKVPATPIKPRDGIAAYDMTLPISEKMEPGKWRLTQIDITQDKPHIIPFSGVAAFAIEPLHPIKLVDIQRPKSVEAGQLFTVRITVDGYPNEAYDDCGAFLGIQLNPAPHEQSSEEQMEPTKRSYEFSSRYYPDTPGGQVQGEVLYRVGVVGSGDKMGGCRAPNLEGDRKFELDVTPAQKSCRKGSTPVARTQSGPLAESKKLDELAGCHCSQKYRTCSRGP
jgi:hypothetical protein